MSGKLPYNTFMFLGLDIIKVAESYKAGKVGITAE